MKKQLLFKLTFLLLVSSTALQAQFQNGLWIGRQANNWCFGNNAGIEFSTGSPLPLLGVQSSGPEGTTTISDSNGQLLFYAGGTGIGRGTALWNKNHEQMLNGTGLLADPSSTQFGVFIPKPNNPDIYYLFQIHRTDATALRYSEIDMTLDGGNGAVTENKNILLEANAKVEKITAVHHANGKDIWVISHKNDSDEFIAYLVTEAGISTTPVISAVGLSYSDVNYTDSAAYAVGQLKASPDGKRLASVLYGVFAGDTGIEVLDFNNETGEVSNPMFITDAFSNPVYGVEFSPNGRYLYGSQFLNVFNPEVKILQLDLNAGDLNAINNSATPIASVSDGSAFAAMQLAPDGKIYYVTALLPSQLGVINYPNNPAIAAGVSTSNLEGSFTYGLPTFIQSYFESGILYEGSRCFGERITFSTIRIPGITGITWNFGDPDSGAENVSAEPSHIFSRPGTYTVTASITSNGAVQTATKEIVIIAGPNADLPAAQLLTQCADSNGNAIFNLSQFNAAILGVQDVSLYSLAYFASEADRLANIPIVDSQNFVTSGQTIYAVVTSLETGCNTIMPLTLIVNPLPSIAAPEAMEKCGDVLGNATFNLTLQDASILAGRDQNNFTITYFIDATGTNAITNPQNFTSSGQIIYVSLTDNATGCFATASFNLVVNPAGSLPPDFSLSGCPPFDLTSISSSLDTGVNLSFYTNEQDALSGNNMIPDAQTYNFPDSRATIYIVAKNPEGCVSFGQLLLQSAGCIIPKGISPNSDGMNDTFDLSVFNVKRLEVFNRYGQEVYSHDNYTNQWHGQAGNGNELPTGTYYYSVQLNNSDSKTGWVYINRETN
jgi:gliding motility-associated-like protein